MLKICIVGLGRAGYFHIDSIASSSAAKVAVVVDTNRTQLTKIADQLAVPGFDSLEKAMNRVDFDAVIVASPTDSHYAYVLQALGNGKHVFAEKPLGNEVDELKNCFEQARQAKKALYLGFNRRYDKHFIQLRERIAENQTGDLRYVKITSRDNPCPSIAYLSISKNIFHDMLIHDFDMLINLFGEQTPETVFATGHAHDPEIGALNDFDLVSVTLKFPNGMIANIDTSRISPYGYDQRIEVFGKAGMLLADNVPESTVKQFNKDHVAGSVFKYSFPQRYADAYRLEIDSFIKGIQQEKMHNVSEKACLLSHLIADAAFDSACNQSVIDFLKFCELKV